MAPWFLQAKGDETCVRKGTASNPGPEVACHDSREKANKHLRALYRAENDAAAIPALTASDFEAAEALLAHYSEGDPAKHANRKGSRVRLYFVEDEATPDGRYIDAGSINFNRKPPFPFRIQTRQPESGGHAGAELAGVLTKYAVVPKPDGSPGNVVVLEGPLDMKSEAGKLSERLIREGFLQTWSPDLGDVTWDTEVLAVDEQGFAVEAVEHVVSATMLGGTAVALPALASAVIELLDDDGEVVTPALVRGIAADGGMVEPQPYYVGDRGPETYIPTVDGIVVDGSTITITTNGTNAISTALKVAERLAQNNPQDKPQPVLACVPTDNPPAAFFSDPQLEELQRWTEITDEGRVFGHVAGRGECHIGYSSRCITIEEIADYTGRGNFEYANGVGYVITKEGARVGTGPLAVIGGHADKSLAYNHALAYYKDDPANIVADVVYGRDKFGIWFSGALRPTATREQVYSLRANGVSLDARDIDGDLRYIAACCVCKPGYPKIAARLTAASLNDTPRILTLVAAGGPPEPNLTDEGCGCEDCNDDLAAFEDLELRVLSTRVESA